MSIRLLPECGRAAAGLLLVLCGHAAAADALDLRFERERQRVANERRRVDETYKARVQQCETQFFVTSCIEEARAQRRAALDRLTQQQAVLEDALRKQRVAERLERLQEKQRLAAERRNAPVVRPRVVHRATAAASAASAIPAATGASGVAVRATDGPSAQERRRNEEAYRQRQRAADAHREAVERRNAERAATHRPAASLPVPASVPPGLPGSGASR